MSRLLTLAGLAMLAVAAFAQDFSGDPRVRVVTNLGEFIIVLDPARAPITVESFLANVDAGHYDGTIFHRVVPGFIAQGGGYTPDLTLRPTEISLFNESGNGLSNMRGTVGMARANDPHSATTQFFVNLADNLDLNPRPTRWGYAVFGRVEEGGMGLIDRIGDMATTAAGPFDSSVPVQPIIIERVERIVP